MPPTCTPPLSARCTPPHLYSTTHTHLHAPSLIISSSFISPSGQRSHNYSKPRAIHIHTLPFYSYLLCLSVFSSAPTPCHHHTGKIPSGTHASFCMPCQRLPSSTLAPSRCPVPASVLASLCQIRAPLPTHRYKYATLTHRQVQSYANTICAVARCHPQRLAPEPTPERWGR